LRIKVIQGFEEGIDNGINNCFSINSEFSELFDY